MLGRHADRIALAREFGATDVVSERGAEGSRARARVDRGALASIPNPRLHAAQQRLKVDWQRQRLAPNQSPRAKPRAWIVYLSPNYSNAK